MNEQIRIPPNGRGKVRIAIKTEPKVHGRGGLIGGELHGPENEEVYEAFGLFSKDGIQNALERSRALEFLRRRYG